MGRGRTDTLFAVCLVVLFGYFLLFVGFHVYDEFQGDHDSCQTWAENIHAGSDDYGMHLRGCDEQLDGTYKRVYTRCMVAAYEEVEKGTKADNFMRTVGSYGCVLYEDGTWGDE